MKFEMVCICTLFFTQMIIVLWIQSLTRLINGDWKVTEMIAKFLCEFHCPCSKSCEKHLQPMKNDDVRDKT